MVSDTRLLDGADAGGAHCLPLHAVVVLRPFEGGSTLLQNRTSALIGAQKCKLPPFRMIIIDRSTETDQTEGPTNRPMNRRT